MKVIILGASGLLGKALTREWVGDEVVGLGSRDLDIRDAGKVREVVEKASPEWIVLSAAYTNVDDCESHPDLASAVKRETRAIRRAFTGGPRLRRKCDCLKCCRIVASRGPRGFLGQVGSAFPIQ